MRSHRRIELRSMALHRAVADRLRADPALMDDARTRVERWREDGSVAAYYVNAWASLLSRGVAVSCALLAEDSEHAHAMRQVSPFAGVLPPRQRWAILRGLADD